MTALEIRRDVEGYSGMNEDAFARRFYADRAELESLGIHLTVDRPVDGVAEQENYSLRPENFHLPAIAFTDEELASLQFALTLLDGEFAYAEPLRLALQQISWGRPSPAADARAPLAGAGPHRQRRRPRPLPAPGQGRDGHLPLQDDHLRLLHDGARRGGGPQGRPLPPALPGRPVLPAGPQPRARRAAGVPPLAHARQGRLRVEGRARLQAPRRVRPARLRQPRRVAVRRARRRGAGLGQRAHRLAGRAPLRPLRRDRARRRRRAVHHALRQRAPDGRLGPEPRRARAHRGPARAGRRDRRARRAAGRAPRRRAPAGRRGAALRRRRRGTPRSPSAAAPARPRSAPSASRAW